VPNKNPNQLPVKVIKKLETPMCLPWESFSQKLRLSTDPHNHIEPNPLHPPVLASECITKWLTPYGIVKLDSLILKFPIDIIIHCCLCLINSIQPSMLSNYSTSLLCFNKFCDDYGIPENDHMPASEAILSLFIAT